MALGTVGNESNSKNNNNNTRHQTATINDYDSNGNDIHAIHLNFGLTEMTKTTDIGKANPSKTQMPNAMTFTRAKSIEKYQIVRKHQQQHYIATYV